MKGTPKCQNCPLLNSNHAQQNNERMDKNVYLHFFSLFSNRNHTVPYRDCSEKVQSLSLNLIISSFDLLQVNASGSALAVSLHISAATFQLRGRGLCDATSQIHS